MESHSLGVPILHAKENKIESFVGKVGYLLVSDRRKIFDENNIKRVMEWALERYPVVIVMPTGASQCQTYAFEKVLLNNSTEVVKDSLDKKECAHRTEHLERTTVNKALRAAKDIRRTTQPRMRICRIKSPAEEVKTPVDYKRKQLNKIQKQTEILNNLLYSENLPPVLLELEDDESPLVDEGLLSHPNRSIAGAAGTLLGLMTIYLRQIIPPDEEFILSESITRTFEIFRNEGRKTLYIIPSLALVGRLNLPKIDQPDDIKDMFNVGYVHPSYHEAQCKFFIAFKEIEEELKTLVDFQFQIRIRNLGLNLSDLRKEVVEYAYKCIMAYFKWEIPVLLMMMDEIEKAGNSLHLCYPLACASRVDDIFKFPCIINNSLLMAKPDFFRYVNISSLMEDPDQKSPKKVPEVKRITATEEKIPTAYGKKGTGLLTLFFHFRSPVSDKLQLKIKLNI
jgi:hypothetical protein